MKYITDENKEKITKYLDEKIIDDEYVKSWIKYCDVSLELRRFYGISENTKPLDYYTLENDKPELIGLYPRKLEDLSKIVFDESMNLKNLKYETIRKEIQNKNRCYFGLIPFLMIIGKKSETPALDSFEKLLSFAYEFDSFLKTKYRDHIIDLYINSRKSQKID
jgi:hypothetical protein